MLKTILAHLRGTNGDTATLAAALAVGRLFSAHIEALHIRPDIGSLIARTRPGTDEFDGSAIADAVEQLQEQAAREAQRASDAYEAFCHKEDILRAEHPPGPNKPNAAFREVIGEEVELLTKLSRGHDLLVVKGGCEEGAGLSMAELGRLITGAGKPVLLAPNAAVRPPKTVAIAWKDVPEAARAVTAAIPILEKAERIYVMSAVERGVPTECDEVVSLLKWHGLDAEAQRVVTGTRDDAHAVLETTRAAKADLLVMGAYGHSRLAETILGGFTQAVLEDASLPVFLFH